ncbi:hypothetical protein [Aquimarina brevivitae]|uniref:Prophage protein DUF1660 n=1 Tax=Aquimarina brevivitae TaxID=323412 RepID=A0A4Q7PGD3_9FLAO|nr:hypothetical protein [Aquimarina brevivitae]RZS99564.1 hypothetical protein EV197_0786 [Aquimarina brevivitae]
MTKSTSQSGLSFSKLYCSLFGHKFEVTKKITNHVKEYTCCHCKEQATINSRGKLEKLTPKLKEANKALASVHKKKVAKENASSTFQAAS